MPLALDDSPGLWRRLSLRVAKRESPRREAARLEAGELSDDSQRKPQGRSTLAAAPLIRASR